MIILCEYCDLRYICYDDWMEHLLSSEHQDVISKAINSWDLPLNERSLVITINGTKPEKTDICWYFASFGLVSDAFFESDLQFCVIQLDKKDYAANAMAVKHSMESANLSLRLKSDISDAEWIQLNRMGRRNSVENIVDRRKELKESFEDRHLKLSRTLTTLAIDTQMEIFERETIMSSSEFNLRQNLLKDINRLFNRDYPKSILCPYGSFLTGLGDKSSVLHMYFDAIGLSALKEQRYQGMLPSKKEIMESLEKCIGRINQKQLFCHDFVVLPRDVPPCIQFTHYATGVTCRFTFESLLPIQTSKLIALVMKLDARLPALFLFVRYWGKYYKICGPKLITSYSLNLLLFVFLTTKKIIPSIAALLSMGNDMKEINGWETGFCDDKEKIVNVLSFLGVSSSFATNPNTGKPTAKSILELAVDFFKMYAHTDLQSQVVCSAIGDFLPKSAFERGKETNLPKGLEAYKTRILIQKRRLDTNSLLCIQDPFDLMSNVSSSTPDDLIWKFQFLCADTIDNIEKVLKSPNLNLMDIFNLKANEIENFPTENQSGISRSGGYRFEGSLLASPNDSYGTSRTRQEDSAYLYQQQTRDVPFSYGNHQVQPQPVPSPHHSEMFHHSQHPQNPSSHQSEIYHQQYPQDPTAHHPDMFPHPQQHDHHPPDAFHRQQYNSSQQHFENNEMFTVPHHLQSYHQQDPGNGLLATPTRTLNPPAQFSQSFHSGNPTGQPMVSPGKSSKAMGQRQLVSVATSSFNSKVVPVPPPPSLAKPAPAPAATTSKPTAQAAKRQRKRSLRSIKFPSPSRSLQFGTFERVYVFPPDKGFQRLFNEYFGNLVAEPILEMRLKVIWCMFMKDFFSDIWWKGFLFKVEEMKEFNIPVGADSIKSKIVIDYSARVRHAKGSSTIAKESDEAPDPKKAKPDSENATEEGNKYEKVEEEEKPICYLFPPHENPHQREFFEIQIKYTYSNALACTVANGKFIVGRAQVRGKAWCDQELLAKFPDLLELEGHVTKTALAANKNNSFIPPSEFVAKISLDASNEDSVTLVIKDIIKDLSVKGNVQNLVSHLTSVFRDLIPKYSVFRLRKWLSTVEAL